jgi:hypothetical protein
VPSLRQAAERLKWEVEQGHGDEKVHVVFVERDQAERIKNDKRKTRFVLCCDDPDLCAKFEAEKDRIFRKVKNKALMLTLMERAWEEALADAQLDKILAALEAPDAPPLTRVPEAQIPSEL